MKELQLLKDAIFDSHPNVNEPKIFLEERLRAWYADISENKDKLEQLAKELGSSNLNSA